jgi:hypothetical protein
MRAGVRIQRREMVSSGAILVGDTAITAFEQLFLEHGLMKLAI